MALYVAGQRIRASELNRLPQMYYVTSDLTKTTSTVYSNVTGLAFAADAATRYFVEFHIAFEAPAAADICFQWSGPGTPTGLMCANGVESGDATGDVGDDNRQAVDLITGEVAFAGAGAQDCNCSPWATLLSDTAGTFQLKYRQLVSSGSTIIRAGSVMRITKLT